MKFAHMADCHIGSWRDDKLRTISTEAFVQAVDISIREGVSFILISGDLFNTAIPSIESLRIVVKKLSELKKKGIAVYLISGSHDYSPSGQSMIDVLEEAGLCVNVAKADESSGESLNLKVVTDPDTGAKIVGLVGRRGGLEDSYYHILNREALESEKGFKIFMFHSAIEEYKPKHLSLMKSIPLSLFPKGFDYYAGGHVHVVMEKDEPGYGKISFPGPLFPNDFRELEVLGRGGFYIYTDGNLTHHEVTVYKTISMRFDCEDKTPDEIKDLVLSWLSEKKLDDTIVTLRFSGKIRLGVPTDIDWSGIISKVYEKGAYFVMKNTVKLTTEEFEEIKANPQSAEAIEDSMIREHIGQVTLTGVNANAEAALVKELFRILDDEKQDGERVADYERRLLDSSEKWIKTP